MTQTIQTGTAQVLTYTGQALRFTFIDATTLIIQCRNEDCYVAMAEGDLQISGSRFKLSKMTIDGDLSLTFPIAQSGTLYFASAAGAATSTVSMWQFCGGGEYGY